MNNKSINTANYEAYLLDYLEGNLSREDQMLLLAFLEDHPDLKEEFDSVASIILPLASPSEDTFTGKSELKKAVVLNENECLYNEELAIKAFEEDASLLELKEHHNLLQNDGAYRRNFNILKLTRQKVDLTIEFPYKSGLKKRTIIPLSPGQWMQFSSVAATLAVLLLAADLFFTEPTTQNDISQNNSVPEGVQTAENNSQAVMETAGPQPAQSSPAADPKIETSQPASKPAQNTGAIRPANHHNNSQATNPSSDIHPSSKNEFNKPGSSHRQTNNLASLQPKERRRIDPSLFEVESNQAHASLLPAALPAISFYTTDAEPSQEAISLSDYLLLRFKRDVLKLECDDPQNPQLKLYEIADAGLQQINKVSKDRIKWEAQRDPNGNLSAYNLKTPILEISRP